MWRKSTTYSASPQRIDRNEYILHFPEFWQRFYRLSFVKKCLFGTIPAWQRLKPPSLLKRKNTTQLILQQIPGNACLPTPPGQECSNGQRIMYVTRIICCSFFACPGISSSSHSLLSQASFGSILCLHRWKKTHNYQKKGYGPLSLLWTKRKAPLPLLFFRHSFYIDSESSLHIQERA